MREEIKLAIAKIKLYKYKVEIALHKPDIYRVGGVEMSEDQMLSFADKLDKKKGGINPLKIFLELE